MDKINKQLYSNRIAVRPGEYAEADIQSAVKFSKAAGFSDICLFLGGEEANTGFVTEAELDEWIKTARKTKQAVLMNGMTFSVNPWNTLLHTDRGRKLKPGQNFQRMVDCDGRETDAVSCPLCNNWRNWLTNLYGRICTELTPEFIWVEDDFRIHNHAPLRWGGCFCPLHMAEYSKRFGKTVNRESFLKGVLAGGEPHIYRKIWLDTHRDTMTELARLIGETVRLASPGTKVGLMSSAPRAHCAEGRNWQEILHGLSGTEHKPVNRIHLPAYSEGAPGSYMRAFNEVSLCVRSMCPTNTVVLPELENFPFSRFIKSAAFTRFQLDSMAPLNVSGVMADLFDIGGGGIMPDEGYGVTIINARRFAEKIAGTNIFNMPSGGVSVCVNSCSSYTMHTDENEKNDSISAIYPEETFWAGLLGSFGVPIRYSADSLPTDGVASVSGQVLRSYNDFQIKSMFFDCAVILTGDAAAVLLDMGLGSLAGIKSIKRIPQLTGIAYEEASDGAQYFNITRARCSAQDGAGDYYTIEYDRPVAEFSKVYDYMGNNVGGGVTMVDNKILILPYGDFNASGKTRHFHPLRQALIQRALKIMKFDLFVENARDVFAYRRNMPDGTTALYLVNASMDPCHSLHLYTGSMRLKEIKLIDDNGENVIVPSGAELPVKIPALGCALLLLKHE